MNDKIQNHELHKLIQQLNLPKNLTFDQLQEISLYAAYKLNEQRRKKIEKIIFNPEIPINGDNGLDMKSTGSIAKSSHAKYKSSNLSKKLN
jgi:hypothetical protein